MKRAAAVVALSLATLYTLFCIVLVFVGCFTTVTIFPNDSHDNKAIGFGFFSFFLLAVLWFGGWVLVAAADSEAHR